MNLRNIFATLGKEFKLGFSLKMIKFLVRQKSLHKTFRCRWVAEFLTSRERSWGFSAAEVEVSEQ